MAASKELHVTPQTISAQIKSLEETLGVRLLEREGRGLRVTEAGRTTKEYADGIFSLARELEAALRGDAKSKVRELRVGISDALPKVVCHRLLEPVLRMAEPMRLVCREHGVETLLSELAVHHLDLVLNDAPIPQGFAIRAYSHLLGECGIRWVATPELAEKYGGEFPSSLQNAPFILPTEDTALRRSLNLWFSKNNIQPRIVAEIADSALLKAFGENGDGIFPVADVVLQEIERRSGVVSLGKAAGVSERFYAISVERRIKHPAAIEISRCAKDSLFDSI